jgi:hypothetical protein
MIPHPPPRGIVLQTELSDAIQQTINDVINALPAIIAAILILVAGYVIGRVLGGVVTRLVRRVGIDRYIGEPEEDEMATGDSIARALGLLVAFYVYFVTVIAAADVLNIAILSELLADLGAFLPVVFGAVVILVIGFIVGRLVGGIVAEVVSGFDVGRFLDDTPLSGLSDTTGEFGNLVGKLVAYYVYLLTLLTVAEVLDIDTLSMLLDDFAGYLPALFAGLLVLVVGIWLAEVIEDIVTGASEGRIGMLLGIAAKVFVYYVTITVTLTTIGVDASPLTTLFTTFVVAFFGALAIALAIGIGIAFGLGGQDYVAENIDGWMQGARAAITPGADSSTEEEEGGEPQAD